MSGGVDSSVAALLMQQAGYQCVGVTMRLHSDTAWSETSCCANNAVIKYSALDHAAINDAAQVCAHLGIEHQVWDFSTLFTEQVIMPFVAAYRRGETPNPCIDCNRQLKFGALLAAARQAGFQCLVTGHYARTSWDVERQVYRLLKASLPDKDQSYVLYQLSQSDLAFVSFPLGELSKDQVRQIALDAGLPTAEREDSQDICFIEDDYQSFLKRVSSAEDNQELDNREHAGSYSSHECSAGNNSSEHSTSDSHVGGRAYCADCNLNQHNAEHLALADSSGEIVDSAGNVLGYHQGISDFTIGQRRGLGIAVGHPLYVTQIDADTKRVTVGEENELLHKKALLRGFTSPVLQELQPVMEVQAKYRYRSIAAPARLVMFDDGRWEVQFYESQKALTPGQALVCYQGDQLIAGGTISEARG
jgi:tRNA-specific 2-thiouridylase